MKTLPVLTVFTSLAAAVVALPFGFEVAVSTLFTIGLIGILITDYTQAIYSHPMRFAPVARRTERLRLAA